MNGKIYIIKNTINDKVYIGQTIQDVNMRFYQHKKYTWIGENQIIHKAFKKYGNENFFLEILEENIDNYDELNEKEIYYIQEYNSLIPNGYNMCPGGQLWRNKGKLNDEEVINLIEDYLKGLSTRELNKKYNITSSKDYLHKNNIELRDKSWNLPDRTSKITKEIMYDLYIVKNLTVKEISDLLDVCEMTVRRARKRYELEKI